MPIKNNQYLVLYENCGITVGYTSAIIVDFQRGDFITIPKSFGEFILASNRKKVSEIYKSFGKENKNVVTEYLEFLVENEFAFYTLNVEFFPVMSTKWNEPSHITNAIIDFSFGTKHDKTIYKKIRDLGAKHIQFRFFAPISLLELKATMSFILNEEFEAIELILKYSDEFSNPHEFEKLCNYLPIISVIHIMESPNNSFHHFQPNNFGYINYSTTPLDNEKNCGLICKEFFTINLKSYTESLNHNSCLNRKLSIDSSGNVKNCPSMKESFGKIDSVNITEIIKKKEFKKFWNITKNEIKVCKDCEFRNICTDCRAYVENPKDNYSKPLKCGYDPYSGIWDDWSNNQLKVKAIKFYEMDKLIINQ